MCVQVVDPSLVDYHYFINEIKISYSQVTALETATCVQFESELWVMLHNGRLVHGLVRYILKRQGTKDPIKLGNIS